MMLPFRNFLVVLLSLSMVVCIEAFGVGSKSKTSASRGAITDEAIEIFSKKFPFGEKPKANILTGETGNGRRLFDVSEKQARNAFNELAKLYGEENALEMVKIQPLSLAFNSKQFQSSLQEFTNIFGENEAKAMVLRNPGLLAVGREEASKSNEQTMAFSYLVAYTRPVSGVLLPGLIVLLLVPFLEKLTGFTIGL